jgi:hypothetical protein
MHRFPFVLTALARVASTSTPDEPTATPTIDPRRVASNPTPDEPTATPTIDPRDDPIPRQCLYGAVSEIDYITPLSGCFIQHVLPDNKCWAKEWNTDPQLHDRLHPWHCPITVHRQNSLFYFDNVTSQIRIAAAPELCVAMMALDDEKQKTLVVYPATSFQLELASCEQTVNDSQWRFLPLSGQFQTKPPNSSDQPLCAARYGLTIQGPKLRAGPCNEPNTCEFRAKTACSNFRWVLPADIAQYAAAATAAPAAATIAACLFAMAASWGLR